MLNIHKFNLGTIEIVKMEVVVVSVAEIIVVPVEWEADAPTQTVDHHSGEGLVGREWVMGWAEVQ